jgi:endonuclease III
MMLACCLLLESLLPSFFHFFIFSFFHFFRVLVKRKTTATSNLSVHSMLLTSQSALCCRLLFAENAAEVTATRFRASKLERHCCQRFSGNMSTEPNNPFDSFQFKSEPLECKGDDGNFASIPKSKVIQKVHATPINKRRSIKKANEGTSEVAPIVAKKMELSLSSEIAIGSASHYRIVINSLRSWKRTSNSTSTVDDYQVFLSEVSTVQSDFPFMVLCTGILACQCRDMVAMKATKELIAVVGGDLKAPSLSALTVETIESVIKTVNYFKSKAKSLVKLAAAVSAQGSVPNSYKGLVALPGIGPKIANLCLSVAFKHGGDIVEIREEDWALDDSLPSSPYFSASKMKSSSSMEVIDGQIESECKSEPNIKQETEGKVLDFSCDDSGRIQTKIEGDNSSNSGGNDSSSSSSSDGVIDISSPGNGGNSGGIIVDTHVHKVCKRIGWSKGQKTPEGTRKIMEGIAPHDHWDELTVLLIGIAQSVMH